MKLIDTHTHLYLPEFDKDRNQVMARAHAAGIERFYLPNIDSSSIAPLFKMAEDFPDTCFPMMGLHPCSVGIRYSEELKIVEHWLGKRKFSAVGEIGIDLYWDKTYMEHQLDAFRYQIKLAKQHDLPIVIHTRNSFEEVFRIVKEEQDGKLRGIFHCFSGKTEEAQRVASLGGFKLGIGGVLTFKNSGLDQVLADIDLRHFVLETDAPYLAPAPHRGKRNEPSYIPLIALKIAEIKRIHVEEVAECTSQNAFDIFTA